MSEGMGLILRTLSIEALRSPAERRVSNDDFLVALVNDRPHEDGTVVERDELVLVVLGDGLVGFENGLHDVAVSAAVPTATRFGPIFGPTLPIAWQLAQARA